MRTTIDTSTVTVDQAFDYYINTNPDLAVNTVKYITDVRKRCDKAKLVCRTLNDLSPGVIKEFNKTLAPLAPSYKHRIFVHLKTVVNTFLGDHELPKYAWDNISKAPKIEEAEEGEEAFITLHELRNFIDKAKTLSKKQQYGCMLFAFGCLTGMALSDLLSFTPEKISSDGKWITYHRQKTGSKCVVPVLPLTTEIMNTLHWPVRISSSMYRKYCTGAVSKIIGRPLTSHSARKSFGSIFAELGFSIQTISACMGHSDTKITYQLYSRVSRDKMERELSTVPKELIS